MKSPFIYSFIYFHSRFSSRRIAGAAALALAIPHSQQQFQIILLAPHQDGIKRKVEDVVTPPSPWSTSGPLSRGFSQQDLLQQSFLGHSGHVAKPTFMDLSIQRSGSTFRALQISQQRTLSRSVIPWTLRKNPITAAFTWDNILSVITQDCKVSKWKVCYPKSYFEGK